MVAPGSDFRSAERIELSQTTCWTVIDAAARGEKSGRAQFAEVYLSVIRAYLTARWRGSRLSDAIDDAAQEVFVECFREGGPLARADRAESGGFRPFLFGLVRNVARRFESKPGRVGPADENRVDLQRIADNKATISHVFDRAWARAIMQQAAQLQADTARESGESAIRRVELLRLRFRDGHPIRKIAELWGEDAARLHHEYAKARSEFQAALSETLAFHRPGASAAEIQQECESLLGLLK
jgi:hypothetical protein